MTQLNYWHYIVFGILFLMYIGGVFASLKQTNKKLIFPMLVSVTLIIGLVAVFSIFIVDKYTKVVKLYQLTNKRLLSTEQIIYYGTVRNEGNHEIGEVTLELKLINKGHATGNVKAGSFYNPSGFMEFFGGGANILFKPQTIKKKFVVAKNLKPRESESFSVYFDYPPYFSSVSQFSTVSGH